MLHVEANPLLASNAELVQSIQTSTSHCMELEWKDKISRSGGRVRSALAKMIILAEFNCHEGPLQIGRIAS